MRSVSNREAIAANGAHRRFILFYLAVAVFLSAAIAPLPARGGVRLTEMARLEASDEAAISDTRTLFRGYVSLGLFPEAALILERKVRLGLFSLRDAAPLFEDAAAGQARFGDPSLLVSVCETAIRSGVRTPAILYYYGTGLRKVPGRVGDASAILVQVGAAEPYQLLSLYSLGQMAAERGDEPKALDLFRRVEEGDGGLETGGRLAARAARSRAELLLASGRRAAAAAIFESLLRRGGDPLDRIGLAAAGDNAVSGLEHLPAEMIAGRPFEDRVRFLVLSAGVARKSGRYDLAVDRLERARQEIRDALSLAAPPASEPLPPFHAVESLRIQLEGLRAQRKALASPQAFSEDEARSGVVELLVGLLVVDQTAALGAAETRSGAGARFLSPGDAGEIVRRIEEVSLDGADVDGVIKRLSATLDTLQNLGHPMDRYRRIGHLEKSQTEIHRLRDRIRERGEATVSDLESGKDGNIPLLIRDVGLFLKELETIRSTVVAAREFTRQYFDILRKREPAAGTEDPLARALRETIAYADSRLTVLLPAASALAEQGRAEAWKRREPERIALRAMVTRQLADTLVRRARYLRQQAADPAGGDSVPVLARAVSLLSGNGLDPAEAADVAVDIGSVLLEGKGRWALFPGPEVDEKEKDLVARILPLLPRGGTAATRRERGLYLDAALRLAVNDPGSRAAARQYLEKYPASPLSAGIAVRLGHEALLSGDIAGALARYRAAAGSGNPEAAAVARYMLAWSRFQSGDAAGALEYLSRNLSDPSFACGDPSSFEKAALSLAVRAGKDTPLARLEAYSPVKEATCGGKAFLSSLWEAEEQRGEVERAAQLREVASRSFPRDENAAALEVETVRSLLRAGKEEDALSRALSLREKYGPGSAWSRKQPAPVQAKAAADLEALFRELGERKFAEGLQTGERPTLSSAAVLLEEYFRVEQGKGREDDSELRLKQGVALVRSGNRESGVPVLQRLALESQGDLTGERAAVLYAETMIAGYERKETPAADAEDAARLLLRKHPSAKADSLALRAATAFLAAKEYGRARTLSEEVERARTATPERLREARLIAAEADVFERNFAGARGKADLVLTAPTATDDPVSAARAKDLYVLASLKGIEEMSASGNAGGAASALEKLAERFSEAQERPLYLLRA
ncbi:MAG: hypothetical protein ACM3L8_03725, partial [Verrucomicrobiota bacterium]